LSSKKAVRLQPARLPGLFGAGSPEESQKIRRILLTFEHMHGIVAMLWMERLPTGVLGRAEWPVFFDINKQAAKWFAPAGK